MRDGVAACLMATLAQGVSADTPSGLASPSTAVTSGAQVPAPLPFLGEGGLGFRLQTLSTASTQRPAFASGLSGAYATEQINKTTS